MRTKRTLSVILLASACSADPTSGGDLGDGDDEAPLGSYEGVVGGAPPNHMLPDDNKADAVYPAKHSELVALQSPVKSQGRRGVCSIFATTALMESLYIEAGVPNPDFSEQFLQWSVKNEVGAYRNTSGSNAAENLQAISEYGLTVESAWPYEPNPWTAAENAECQGEESKQPVVCFTNGDPPQTAMDSERNFLPRGRWLNTNSIKAHISTKKSGVQVGLDFFYQAWNHRKSTLPVNSSYWSKGYVLFPNDADVEESHKQRAGHSIVIVGWDDDLEVPIVDKDGKQILDASGKPKVEKGFYIFKNSWGTAGFGIENPFGPGYGYLSMKYVNWYGSAYVADVPRITPPPAGGGDHFEVSPRTTIPDNTPAGVSSTLSVPAGNAVAALTVTVDISHSYSGDITLTLTHGGKTVTLQAGQGGADDDIKKTFTVAGFTGDSRQGEWTLTAADLEAQDAGVLNKWAIDLR